MAIHAYLLLGAILPFLATVTFAQTALPTGTAVVCPAISSTLALAACSTMLEAIYLCDGRFGVALPACSSEYSRCYGTSVDSGSLFRSVVQVQSSYCNKQLGTAPTSATAGILTGTSALSASSASSTTFASTALSSSGSSSASARSSSSPSASSTQSQASPTASSQSAAVATRPLLSALYILVGLVSAATLI